ncbi:MAG: calcium-binding protein, partial [Saezia sp.]
FTVARYINAYWGNDDLILTHKNGDKITVYNYFNNEGNSAYRLEEIRFSNGTSWNMDTIKQILAQPAVAAMSMSVMSMNTSVDALVSAMSSFDVPVAAGDATLMQNQQQVLAPALAVNF